MALCVPAQIYQLKQTDRKGQAIVINELHVAPSNKSFSAEQRGSSGNNDRDYGLDSRPPGDVPAFLPLAPTDYTVTPSGNTLFITINSLEGKIIDGTPVCQTTDCLSNPFYEYTFRISYSISPGNLKLDTTTYGFNIRFELSKVSSVPTLNITKQRRIEYRGLWARSQKTEPP